MWRFVLWCLVFAGSAEAQVITTVAGTDPVFPSSGVSALNAPLRDTAAVAVDPAGNIYIADTSDNIVVRVAPGGTLTVVAGNRRKGFSGDGGSATAASLSTPYGVTLDSAGNLYIADFGNNRVRRVSGGTITTVAGNGANGFSGDGGSATSASLGEPVGVAVDSSGNLYIGEYSNNRVRKVSGGTITTVVGNGTLGFAGDGGPAISASLNLPQGVAVDAAGNLYIADSGNNRVRKVSGGTITTAVGNGDDAFSGDGGPAAGASIRHPYGVAVDSAGSLYIADFGSNRIRKVSGGTITTVAGNGKSGFSGDAGPATSASLDNPYSVAVDSAGGIFIADASRRLRKVSGGIITTVAGNGTAGFSGDGGLAINASLSAPSGVAVGGAPTLYIADTGNARIRSVSGGTIATVAGNGTPVSSGDGGPPTSGSLVSPTGVAVDSAGNLYIADQNASRIRKVSGGSITTVAGNGTYGYSGDNGPATSASLAGPTSVAVDSSGNLYIADFGNHRIRKVSGGTITTVAGNGTAGNSGDDGPATSASLNNPSGVAVDSAGTLYLADYGNNRIRKVAGGNITAGAGNGRYGFSGDGGPATSASLNGTVAVAVDSSGNLYLADLGNNRVRKVSGGIIITVAGNGTAGFSGDGGPATSASLDSPAGMAVDAAGNLYIADMGNSRIRAVLSGAPTYQAAPAALNFSGVAGAGVPGGQVIALTSTVSGLAFTAGANAPWLTVSPSSGTIPAALQVTADPSALSAGTYQGIITLTAPNGSPATTTIAVTFAVAAVAPAALGVDAQTLSFAATQGGSALAQELHITNSGSGSLDFTASAATSTGGSWLSVSTAAGTVTPSAPASISVIATPGSLTPGTYSGSVTVTGAGKSIAIPATLSVSAPAATILLSQSALSFTAVAQGGVPLPQNFGILNTGQGSMSWTATSSTLSGGNWLQISPPSGTVDRPNLDVSLVSVSIDPSTLAPATYYGRIQVSAVASNTPQVITVILTVLPAGSTLPAQIFPAGLIFTGVAGATPGSQDVQVGNPAGTVNSFLSGIIGTGFSYLPANAPLQPDQPTTIHVYPDFSSLSPGTLQRGTITLQFADGSPSQTIGVLMVVAPSSAGGLAAGVAGGNAERANPTAQPQASGCASQGLFLVFRTPQPSQATFNAVLAQPSTLDVQVTDGCGNMVGLTGQNSKVSASFSNGDSVQMTHIGNGVWQGTWKPLSPGTVRMFVTAFVLQNGTLVGGQSSTLTAVVSAPPAPTPTVTAQGVVHAASAQAGVPIAPGGLISIYGLNLSDSTGQSSALPLPQQLNGTQVLLGNQLLPILYTSSGQLNVQVPYAVPVNTQYQLTVERGNTYSVPQALVVAAGEPGIFTVNQQGSGQGQIVKSDGVTLAQPATPASIGETVVIYCTGLGAVTPKVKEGSPAPGVPPLSMTDNSVSVTIGGEPATVLFSGLTPGSVGLYQINAVVPSGIVTGDVVPVVIGVAGQTSPTSPPVTMSVR
ncbi:MAG TPA: hypothetical protein VGZ73_26425 [Bryobacteraceae bacterium]|nr:hypothetical protein [Bryobacteraceae bacterium]